MKTSLALFPLLILSVQASMAMAADNRGAADSLPPVDTTEWKCTFCVAEEGFSGTVELGLGHVSTDSYKFGEYTGLNEQGGFLIGNAQLRVRGADAAYWNVNVSNLGLDSRSLGVEGGRQGTFKLSLKYDELPHFISDSVATPFLGTGTDSLTLPSTWIRASTTTGMTDLANSLHNVNLETSRKRLGLGLALASGTPWTYAVNVRHEIREGTQRIAGSFFVSTAQLVMPVDTVTDQLDVSAAYTGKKLQARFAYYGSLFSNNHTALNWENPYSAGAGGPDAGQLALSPDNQFHQILASAGYQFTDKTRATADLAFGRMTQNESFLAATVNPSIVVPAQPRSSLDGLVNTLNANLKVTSALTEQLRLNAGYTYNDHDNRTPQASYYWVSTDIPGVSQRTNLPYSFTQSTIKVSGDYRFAKQTKVSIGVDSDARERTYQEVSESRENTVWGKASTHVLDNLGLTLKGAHAERDINGYEVLPWVSPVENPLLRKYNMADRTRDTAGVRADVTVGQTMSFGLGYDYANDDYSKSQIGLTESRESTLGADASAMLATNTSLHVYYTRERINSQQVGSTTFPNPDWIGENVDTVNTGGIGIKHALIKGKFDIGADYTISHSRGEVTVMDGTASPPFPDLIANLNSLKLYATYRLKENMSVNGAYWYEHYQSEDWQLDGVTANTINTSAYVLAFGEQSPSYYANVIMLSLRYKF
jgi:MtrB/PioB family decaheme-associated outer membrane protein